MRALRLIIGMLILWTLMGTSAVAQKDEGDGTSRTSPYPLGQTGELGDYELQVVDVLPDATDQVLAENQFNEPPAPGETFVFVRIEATYTGSDTGTPWVDLNFNVVGDLNLGYSQSTNTCGVIPDEGYEAPELFEGGTTEFNACWSVPEDEVSSLVMYVEEGFSFEDERVWFSLEDTSIATPEVR